MKKKQINQYGNYETREKRFKEIFENMYPNFKYHSEYKTVDDYFKSKCNTCGHIQVRHGQCTRPKNMGKSITCEVCLENEAKRRRVQKELERKEQTKLKEINRLIKILNERKDFLIRIPLLTKECIRCDKVFIANSEIRVHCDECIKRIKEEEHNRRKLWEDKIIKCEECGQAFQMKGIKNKYCSKKCLNKDMDKISKLRKNKRVKRNGRIDYNITLNKLIKKDDKVCRICGELINEKDYIINKEGNFEVGQGYPSIDHIIPVSKGGTHTWDNIQLAHHQCNSIKSDTVYKSIEESEQLRLV